ncbi:hypothetical protein GW17_00033458 [Ensete ventricosum]|uniref:Uncharacterized protein n=1 Tax=Ensete ventricosum TaxID=4639 RepID=A0A426YAZ0_ENSVE|nr:hypothetical protein B296_00017209 [Ensete ventricosum]RWW03388.1 hypothetical protein GW17_00033458 [Ensete ventricosum]RZS20275.1 hypothetical protein BHM03_00052770 [Ensete ventricosum]
MSTGQYSNHQCSLGNVTTGPVQKLLLGSYWIHFPFLPFFFSFSGLLPLGCAFSGLNNSLCQWPLPCTPRSMRSFFFVYVKRKHEAQ